MANTNKNAADARAAAKAKAQQQVRAKERRTTVAIIAVAAAVVVAFAGIVYFIINASKVPTLEEMWAQTNPPVPAGSDETGGIAVGTDGSTGTAQPADAVRMDLYVDFMCPVCNQFEQINNADIEAMREAGTIALFYHPISILDGASSGTKYSTRAANAAAVVADQDPSHFLDFVAALYANQPEENSTGLNDDAIEALAIGAGVPAAVASQFTDGEFTKWVGAATQQASIDGLGGTPTVMLDREILDQREVPYFQQGALRSYIEGLGGATPEPSASN